LQGRPPPPPFATFASGRLPGDQYSVQSVGGSRVRSDYRGRRLVWVVAVAAALAAPPTAAASPAAVDQYTQHLPTARGGAGPNVGKPPTTLTGLLPSKARKALSGPGGQRLARIATSPGLGAPAPSGSGSKGDVSSGNRRGVATVVADTAGTGPSLALVGALAGIAAGGAMTRLLLRRRSSDSPA
jgi:hypothetical protein